MDSTYEFLKYVKVESATGEGELYRITLTDNIDSINETDARRAIQQLLEITMESLEEKVRKEFIQQFKNSLEKKYLLKIQEMGVNLHMIELRQQMLNQT
jgi:FKBP-type peptidyl-prolyl cis-trans isomerase (trigger factor)